MRSTDLCTLRKAFVVIALIIVSNFISKRNKWKTCQRNPFYTQLYKRVIKRLIMHDALRMQRLKCWH